MGDDVAMSLDVRTRVDGEVERLEPGAARDAIASAFESAADLLRPALHYAKHPLTVEVDGDSWHLASDGRSVALFDGAASEGLRLRLTAEQLADLWCDQATPMTWFSGGTLELEGRLEHLLDWWVLLRGAIDQRAPHVAGDIDLSGTDLAQSFTLDDHDDDIRAFLAQAGFVHIRGVYGEDEMAAVSRDMDAAAPDLREGRRPFVVGTDERRRRPARAHAGRGRRVPVDRSARGGRAPRRASGRSPEAAISGGRASATASRRCSSRSVSSKASPTCRGTRTARSAATATSAAASPSGSRSPAPTRRRASCGSSPARTAPSIWPAFVRRDNDLPIVDLPTQTGDVTVHCSCTTHMAQPPVERERRVLYTGFRLPPANPEATRASAGAAPQGARGGTGHRVPDSEPGQPALIPLESGNGSEVDPNCLP